jgi:hypothetical protein
MSGTRNGMTSAASSCTIAKLVGPIYRPPGCTCHQPQAGPSTSDLSHVNGCSRVRIIRIRPWVDLLLRPDRQRYHTCMWSGSSHSEFIVLHDEPSAAAVVIARYRSGWGVILGVIMTTVR